MIDSRGNSFFPPNRTRRKWRVSALPVLLPVLFAFPVLAQSTSNPSANELVRQVVDHEIQEQDRDHSHWMYLDKDLDKKQTKVAIETQHGDLSRLVAENGHPLSAQQQMAEDQRIQKLVDEPAARQKLQQDQKNDAQNAGQLFKMLPNAWTYSMAERNGDDVKLNFHPNPAFSPPSQKARALHEMEGQLEVNAKQKRLISISGRLMQDVKFGWWGVLGHLAKGGTFEVHQQEVAPNHWKISLLKVHMNGKALFFKTISVQQDEVRSHFERVPDSLTLAQAAAKLREAHFQP